MANKKQILIVEDNPDHAELAASAIKKSGDSFDTKVVTTGDECFNVLKNRKYDIILLDYSLSMEDGMTVLREIKDHYSNIPVIVVTGMGNEKIAVESMKLGAYDYIVKSAGYLEILPVTIKKAVKYYENITQRRKAEEKLQRQNEFLRVAIESLTHPFYVIDTSDYTVKLANNAANLGSLAANSTCYELTHNRLEPCQGTKHCCPLREVEKTKKPSVVEHIHYDKDGNARNIEVNCYPILDSSGNVAQVIEYCLDITERKRAEEQIKASLKEKDLLLKEVHHRVKNNLQVISSMLNLQSRKITDQQNLEPFRESQNRIRSMAFIHERLYQSEDLSKVNFKRYLETLATYLLQSYEVNQDSIRLYSEVENVELDISMSITCGLLINELVSNSLKYAFTESQKGEIRIGLKRVGENQYKLVVSDDGIGLPEELDFRNTDSLGLQLVNTLTNQLQGGIEVEKNNGTTFKITFPGPDQAGQR